MLHFLVEHSRHGLAKASQIRYCVSSSLTSGSPNYFHFKKVKYELIIHYTVDSRTCAIQHLNHLIFGINFRTTDACFPNRTSCFSLQLWQSQPDISNMRELNVETLVYWYAATKNPHAHADRDLQYMYLYALKRKLNFIFHSLVEGWLVGCVEERACLGGPGQ